MPAKKQKQPLNYDSDTVTIDTVTIDSGYGAVPYITSIGSSMSDTITLDNTLWSSGSITSPYTTTTTVPNGGYTISTGAGTGYNWSNGTTNTHTVEINADGMKIKEGGDITIGGKSLTKAIEQIEERLAILHPNPALEERWDQLKELRKQYMEMEKDLLEKDKLMKILKET